MKEYQEVKIIGIDNGYGNIKTANCCFPAGLTAHDTEPVFKDELLVYGGRYYLIGTGHKEFKADKTGDDDHGSFEHHPGRSVLHHECRGLWCANDDRAPI